MQEYIDLLTKTREHILTGVSYAIPVILLGAVPTFLASMIGGGETQDGVADLLIAVGGIGMRLFVPVWAAYIAFAIGGRDAIAPGLVCGLIADNRGTGFLGGIIIGLLVGYVVYSLRKWKLRRTMQPALALIVYPLVSTLVGALILIFVVADPVASVMDALTSWLEGMSETEAIALGAILGGMMGYDFGGPVNKLAYAFAVGLMGQEVFEPMGMTGAAIGVAPIGMAIAVLMARRFYGEAERKAVKDAILGGMCTMSETAMPLAAGDLTRATIASVLGAGVAGAIAGGLRVTNHAPMGGILPLPVVDNRIGYLIAMGVGSLVTAVLVNMLKSWGWKRAEKEAPETAVSAVRCVVVTSCTAGIAHTYMAAEAMEQAAKRMGIEATVEAQGSSGIEDELSAEVIEEADFVIIASDIKIERPERFAGKVIYRRAVADAIRHPEKLYEEAIKLL